MKKKTTPPIRYTPAYKAPLDCTFTNTAPPFYDLMDKGRYQGIDILPISNTWVNQSFENAETFKRVLSPNRLPSEYYSSQKNSPREDRILNKENRVLNRTTRYPLRERQHCSRRVS